MPAPTLHEINERRLDAEARRRGRTIDETRALILERGLAFEAEERARKQRERELAADLILLTTGMTEFRELRTAAQSLGYPFETRSSASQEYHHLGEINAAKVATARVESMGSFGAVFSSLQAHVDTGATTLVLIGTAFGIDRGSQGIGDVLIGRSVLLYDRRRAVEHNGGHRLVPLDDAIVRANETELRRFLRAAERFATEGTLPFRMNSCALLSGGALIESARYRDELVARFVDVEPLILGGEMEAGGVVAVCARQRLSWIVVKGVCDFADTTSRSNEPSVSPALSLDDARTIAARNAAEFVLRALAYPHPPSAEEVEDDDQQVF